MASPVLTVPQGYIDVKGNHFVLTGKMWTQRNVIEQQIRQMGGYTEGRMSSGAQVLVVADNEPDDGMLASLKVKVARQLKAAIVRESMLQRALTGFTSAEKFDKTVAQLKHDNPGIVLDTTAMEETRKLLAAF